MKVRVSFTVEIDPAKWEQVYGTNRENIRGDVQQYAASIVWAQFDENGVTA